MNGKRIKWAKKQVSIRYLKAIMYAVQLHTLNELFYEYRFNICSICLIHFPLLNWISIELSCFDVQSKIIQ